MTWTCCIFYWQPHFLPSETNTFSKPLVEFTYVLAYPNISRKKQPFLPSLSVHTLSFCHSLQHHHEAFCCCPHCHHWLCLCLLRLIVSSFHGLHGSFFSKRCDGNQASDINKHKPIENPFLNLTHFFTFSSMKASLDLLSSPLPPTMRP